LKKPAFYFKRLIVSFWHYYLTLAFITKHLTFMKNQQNKENKGDQNQGKKPENMERSTSQQQGKQRENEQRSGTQQGQEKGEQEQRTGEESRNRDVTSRSESDVRNTDRGRLPENRKTGDQEAESEETENLEDEDEMKNR
jgi:hypothetical protein